MSEPGRAALLALPRHMRDEDFGVSSARWTVDLAPCDPKVRLAFHGVEAELHYADALHLAAALEASVAASQRARQQKVGGGHDERA